MTAQEIETALRGMVVIVDTREQDTPRLRARLKDIRCPYVREALDFGDYSAKFPFNGEWIYLPAAIERKMNFDELAQCFCKWRQRFTREFERAKAKNAKIYLLIENASWEDAYAGNYRSQMHSKSFVGSILAFLARYNCQLILCRQQTTGTLIHDILLKEGREMLERRLDDA